MATAPLLRPTFTRRFSMVREEAVAALRARLAETPDLTGRWRGKGRWAELYLPEDERRLWSPYLSVRFDTEEEGCTLFGRFAPHPEVWTFFMFLYGLVAFLALFGGTLGYVQWASDEAAWGFWAVYLGVPLLGLLHLASHAGARLGQAQMMRLKEELDRALEALAVEERD